MLGIGNRVGHVQLGKGPVQTGGMTVKVDQLAVQHAGHLIDAIGHQESPVKDRHFGLIFRQIFSIDIDCAHASPP